MRKLLLLLSLITLTTTTSTSFAATLAGYIDEIYVNDNGSTNVVYVSIVGSTYATSCDWSQGEPKYMIIDLSIASMQEAYSMALSAFMSGHQVHMGSVGTCTGPAGYQVEKLKYIYVVRGES